MLPGRASSVAGTGLYVYLGYSLAGWLVEEAERLFEVCCEWAWRDGEMRRADREDMEMDWVWRGGRRRIVKRSAVRLLRGRKLLKPNGVMQRGEAGKPSAI